MRTKLKWLPRVSAGVLLAANTPLALAQSAGVNTPSAAPLESAAPAGLGKIVVVGTREGLASAQQIKRDKLEIVDSVVADDINKLPDFSVTEALQRVTGIQIARDRGEGSAVAIRGLTQMETTLNGREIFTAGNGRNLDFTDIPAEMVSSISVYKSSAAEHIEGGIGGMIDLRTRRPFDFKGSEIVGSARLLNSSLADRNSAQFSTLLSNRWKTVGGGEFGALLNFSNQNRAWREDQQSTGNPVARTDIIPGQTVIAPNGTSETTSAGRRERTGGSMILQWRPSQVLELYAEGSYAQLRTIQNSYQLNAFSSPTFVAGSPTLFPGTNDIKSITWTNAPISILGFARDTLDVTKQTAIGGIWSGEALTLKGDLSYTQSLNTLFFSGLTLAGTAANFTQNLSSPVSGSTVGGANLLDPANLRVSNVLYRSSQIAGKLPAAQLDGEYTLSNAFFQTLSAGLRYAKRSATNAPGLIVADAAVNGLSASDRPQYIVQNPYGNSFAGASTSGYLAGNPDSARDAAGLRNAFGVATPIPASGDPLGVWHIDENTSSTYLMTKFQSASAPLDGNIGLRVVRTDTSVAGSQLVPDSGAIIPINVHSAYIDYLPSLNLRYQLQEGVFLRGAASKTITRPDFNQLSPSLTLIPNSINPAQNQGSAGNPELKPIRSDNLDLALELYYSRTTSVYVTGFMKQVDGFVTTVSNPEVVGGATYQVSRPQNSNSAQIKGFETGYQQFYDFLPGWLSGLGMQVNYTYIDSQTPNSALGGARAPLQNLSKHSLNLVGMYEKGKLSARIACNWRDKFLSGTANIVGVGSLPIYTKAYGWLDASVRYRLSDRMTLAVEGGNLLRTVRSSYYGTETRPQSSWINDTQISSTVTLRF